MGSISGNARAPAFDLGGRKGSVVGCGDLVGHPAGAGVADEHRDRQVLGALNEVAEHLPGIGHRLLAGEQARIHDHHPGDAIGMLDRYAQADRPAPVVNDGRRVAQVEIGEQRRDELGMAIVGIPADVGRLVGAPEARVIRRDAAIAGIAHRWDHLAPQVRPGRLAVEEDHRLSVADVEVSQPQPVDVAVAGLEVELRKSVEAVVGCAKGLGYGSN